MAKRKSDSEAPPPTGLLGDGEPGEQGVLIDVEPELAKPIIAAAKRYKKALRERQAALAKEIKAKEEIKALVKEAGIKPDSDGNISFTHNGTTVKIKPRDELVKVSFESEDQDDDE